MNPDLAFRLREAALHDIDTRMAGGGERDPRGFIVGDWLPTILPCKQWPCRVLGEHERVAVESVTGRIDAWAVNACRARAELRRWAIRTIRARAA